MLANELIEKFCAANMSHLEVAFKAVNAEKHIAFGEVYVPNVLDTHGEMMLAEDVELLAHRFLATLKNDQIDLMHNNRVVRAIAVESFIVRADDPLYHEGAWVVAIKIDDPELWDAIKAGKYNGFSIEMLVTKVEAEIELEFQLQVFGITEEVDGHSHVFFIQVDKEGNIAGGITSKVDDHYHVITRGTATDYNDNHAHRYALP